MDIELIVSKVAAYYPIVASVVGTFAMIASATPTKADDKVADFLVKAVHFLGANFFKAENKEV